MALTLPLRAMLRIFLVVNPGCVRHFVCANTPHFLFSLGFWCEVLEAEVLKKNIPLISEVGEGSKGHLNVGSFGMAWVMATTVTIDWAA